MGTPIDNPTPNITSNQKPARAIPKFETNEEGIVQVVIDEPETLERLYGVTMPDAASGLMKSALNALGRTGEHYRHDGNAAPCTQVRNDGPRRSISTMGQRQVWAESAS